MSHLEPRDLPIQDHHLPAGNRLRVIVALVDLDRILHGRIIVTGMEVVVCREIEATGEARVEIGNGAERGAEALREVEVSAGQLRRAVKAL